MTALLLGASIGLGVWLVGRALIGRRPELIMAMGALDRSAVPTTSQPRSLGDRVGRRMTAALGGRLDAIAPDLRVTGRTAEHHALEKLATALAGLVVPLVLGIAMVANGVAVPVAAVPVAAMALAAAGFVLPDLLLRDAAKSRRAAFCAALSSYLDLVNVVLAGGAGTETALEAAAEAGDGWAFAEIRSALARSRAMRQSPWDCFAELGDDLGVADLQQLAASVRLAGQQGARVRGSLAAKAASMRGHQLAQVEAAANSASERMALPTVLMFTGFLLFIGYPAVAEILGSSSW